MCTGRATSCSNKVRRHVAATNRFVCTGEFLWKSLSPQQNFVAATSRKKSNQTESVRLVAATKFCCSDKDFHKFLQYTGSDLSLQRVAATCCSNLPPGVYRPGSATRWETIFQRLTDLLFKKSLHFCEFLPLFYCTRRRECTQNTQLWKTTLSFNQASITWYDMVSILCCLSIQRIKIIAIKRACFKHLLRSALFSGCQQNIKSDKGVPNRSCSSNKRDLIWLTNMFLAFE